MTDNRIKIISFAPFDETFLKRIGVSITHEFGYEVKIRNGHVDLSEYFDPNRRQYNGNNLLDLMDRLDKMKYVKVIGIFNVDLFIPILTYIFGQAYLGGRTGIASSYRLRTERYGLKANPELLIERLTKEVVHEIGHTFGLIHCHTPGCVMASSTYVEDIDQKSWHLCNQCREKI